MLVFHRYLKGISMQRMDVKKILKLLMSAQTESHFVIKRRNNHYLDRPVV